MGHRTTQRILECDVCGNTPDDGEYMWEMSGVHWCEPCVSDAIANTDEDETEGEA